MVALTLVCFHVPVFAAESSQDGKKPLLMGVFPYISSVALFKRYAPLKDYLSNQLGYEIALETASDVPTFIRRTTERRYDIVITAPHISLLAVDSGDYRIVARPKQDVVSVVVVSKDSAIKDLAQLAGQVVATASSSALVTRYGKDYLAEQGFKGDKAPTYRAYKSHNAAYEATLLHHTAAALVGFNIVSKALDRGVPLRVIAKLPPLPAIPTLVASDLSRALAQQVEKVFVTMNDTVEGRAILKQAGYPGYWPAGVEDYKLVRPYKPASSSSGSKPTTAQ